MRLENLNLEGGFHYSHGSIENKGTITEIKNCKFHRNSAYNAGAVLNVGVINTIRDSIFDSNVISFKGNAGAISNEGTIDTISGCRFEKNAAAAYGGGVLNGGKINEAFGTTLLRHGAKNGGGGQVADFSWGARGSRGCRPGG